MARSGCVAAEVFSVLDSTAAARAWTDEGSYLTKPASVEQKRPVHFATGTEGRCSATRSVDDLAQAMGGSGVSKSQVSRLCEDIDERVHAFLDRPIEGDWPYLWIDATYVKTRQAGRIVSVAVIVAVGVNADGRREALGMDVGTSEAFDGKTVHRTVPYPSHPSGRPSCASSPGGGCAASSW